MPCKDGGRDWSEASTSQGMPRLQKLEEARMTAPQRLRGAHGFADTLVLDL